ncbi:MAG: DinB family protein [Bacteroidota bacterium]
MDIHNRINTIKNTLTQTFAEIDHWFNLPESTLTFKPSNGGWTIDEILEHIGLTNHFLLILIEKGTRKALEQAKKQDLAQALENSDFQNEKLNEIGQHLSFKWIRPEHMEPRGEKTPEQVRAQLQLQLQQCLEYLDRMPNGEGVLYKTTMTVNDLGKIDVYEYIYFLAQHGQRHLTQMKKVAIAVTAKS